MHLSPEFGLTYKEIEKDLKIDKKVEMVYLRCNNRDFKIYGMAQFLLNHIMSRPDIIVVLGDRYEIFSAVNAAMIAKFQ